MKKRTTQTFAARFNYLNHTPTPVNVYDNFTILLILPLVIMSILSQCVRHIPAKLPGRYKKRLRIFYGARWFFSPLCAAKPISRNNSSAGYSHLKMSVAWIFLMLAGFFEICFTIALKFTHGFTKVVPTLITVLFIALSFFSVSQAMKSIPIGTAYAVWAGIGAAGTVACGILFFGDSMHILRLLAILLIVVGIVGLKFAHAE